MAERIEHDTDAVLATLVSEVTAAAPRPTQSLIDAALADAALTALARDVAAAAPQVSADLAARVLADAAGVAGERAEGVTRQTSPSRLDARQRDGSFLAGLFDRWSGWRTGAVAAMILALAAGFGLGLEGGAGSVLDNPSMDAPITLASLGSGFLEAGGF